jgi:hypothetical protein
MTTAVYGGKSSRTGKREGGKPEATQGTLRQLSKSLALVSEPPCAAQYTGQLRISRGKQPLRGSITLPGLCPGAGPRRLPVYWGLEDSLQRTTAQTFLANAKADG